MDSIDILLPFRVDEGLWPDGSRVVQDLYDQVANQDVAELIFGGPVNVNVANSECTLDFPEGSLRAGGIDTHAVKQVEAYAQRSDSSLYTIPFASPIEPGGQRYFRMRWRILGARPLWRWKRIVGGCLVDLRIADVREGRFAGADRSLRGRILPIQKTNVFVMAPARLELATTSPEPRYVRLLEAHAWESYLRHATSRGKGPRLVVYYWRSEAQSGRPITIDNPFRVFADYVKAPSGQWWVKVLQAAAGVLAAALLYLFLKNWDTAVEAVGRLPWGTAWKFLVPLSLTGLLALWGAARKFVAGGFLATRRAFRRVEAKLLLVSR